MKVMIDIPEEIWEKENFCDYFGAWSEKLQEVIKSGTVVYESDDYVSRQYLVEKATSWKTHFFDSERYVSLTDIQNAPPVTPAEKVGRWEWVQYDSNPNIGNWHCSECKTIIPHMPENTDNTPIYKWCPMCGRRMMQEVEHEAGD